MDLLFVKLSFSQVTTVYQKFRLYYEECYSTSGLISTNPKVIIGHSLEVTLVHGFKITEFKQRLNWRHSCGEQNTL